MDLYILRHGETDWTVQGRLQGHTDIPLNQRGMRQVEEAADRLAGLTPVDVIVSSPLLRARQSARIVADRLGYAREKIVLIPGLKERNFGLGEGLIRAERAEKYPDGNYPGMEPLEALCSRAESVLRELQGRYSRETVLAVAHGAMLTALLTVVTDGRIVFEESHVCLAPGSIHWIRERGGRFETDL